MARGAWVMVNCAAGAFLIVNCQSYELLIVAGHSSAVSVTATGLVARCAWRVARFKLSIMPEADAPAADGFCVVCYGFFLPIEHKNLWASSFS